MARALKIALGTTIDIDVPLTEKSVLDVAHTYDHGATALGYWYSLSTYMHSVRGCNAMYCPRTHQRLHDNGSTVLSAIIQLMISDYPCRVVLALPTAYLSSTPAWDTLQTCHWYTMAEGRIPKTDTCVHYCIVSNSAAMEQWPIQNALIVAHVGPLFTAMKMKLHNVPSELRAHHTHAHDGKQQFSHTWRTESDLRADIMSRKPLDWKALLASYKSTNDKLRYAPQAWLRKLALLVDWDVAHQLETAGQWVYMVWSVLDPRPYFGQCGAIGEARAVIARFADEINGARACTTIYGTKKRKVPMYTHLLRELGPHAFSIVPIRKTTTHNTDAVEIWHIRNVVSNMNTAHSKRKQYYRWLARGNIRKCMPVEHIRQEAVWHHYMQVKCVAMEPIDALRMLVCARPALTAGKYNQLQKRPIPFLTHTTGLKLPHALTLPIPTADTGRRKEVRKAFQQYLREHRIPSPLRAYYLAILTVPTTTTRTLKSLLTDNHVTVSLRGMKEALDDHTLCGCTNAPTHECMHTVHFGTHDVLQAAPKGHQGVLRARTNTKVRMSQNEMCRTVRSTVQKLCRRLPPMPYHASKHTRALSSTVLSCIREHPGQRVLRPGTDPPQHVSPKDVSALKRGMPCHRFIFLDKNSWRYALCCALLWMRVMYQAYNRPEYVHMRTYANEAECQTVLLLYYYYLGLAIPALAKYHSQRSARARLTRALPWIKGFKLPRPPTEETTPSSEASAAPIRQRLLTLAEDTCRTLAHQASLKARNSPYGLHTPKNMKHLATPNTACAGINKSIPVPPGGDMQTREMFSHAHHSLQRPLKQASRIASLLERHYTCAFVTLNVLSQQHLVEGFLQPAQEFFLQQELDVGGGGA